VKSSRKFWDKLTLKSKEIWSINVKFCLAEPCSQYRNSGRQ